MVCSLDGDTYLLDTVGRVLQGDTLVPYLLILGLDYILRTSIYVIKENGFILKKRKKAETMTDADYEDDLANAPAKAETLLHSLEQTPGSIWFYVNAIVF